MDIMLILQIIVLLGAIFIGVRLGGIGIGRRCRCAGFGSVPRHEAG